VQVVMAGWNNFRSMVSGYEVQVVRSRGEGVESVAEVTHE